MNTELMARVLYNMSLDMDYNDYLEDSENEIDIIKKELESIKESSLYNCLENIAMDNEKLAYWKEEQI